MNLMLDSDQGQRLFGTEKEALNQQTSQYMLQRISYDGALLRNSTEYQFWNSSGTVRIITVAPVLFFPLAVCFLLSNFFFFFPPSLYGATPHSPWIFNLHLFTLLCCSSFQSLGNGNCKCKTVRDSRTLEYWSIPRNSELKASTCKSVDGRQVGDALWKLPGSALPVSTTACMLKNQRIQVNQLWVREQTNHVKMNVDYHLGPPPSAVFDVPKECKSIPCRESE